MNIQDEAVTFTECRIEYLVDFIGDFDATMNIEHLEVNYKLTENFKMLAKVSVVLQVFSNELNAYMQYFSDVEVNLTDNDTLVLEGKDFSYTRSLESGGNELLHNLFVSKFKGKIQFYAD